MCSQNRGILVCAPVEKERKKAVRFQLYQNYFEDSSKWFGIKSDGETEKDTKNGTLRKDIEPAARSNNAKENRANFDLTRNEKK